MHDTQTRVLESQTDKPAEAAERGGALICPLCDSHDVSSFLIAPDRFHARTQQFQLMRCASCSSVWLHEPPTADQMPYHYGAMYHEVISNTGSLKDTDRWRKQQKVVCGLMPGGAILDIGCSSGEFLSTLPRDSWKLFGVEIDPGQAQRARENTGGQIFTGDLFDAPLASGTFDVITGFHVLEHLDRPKERMAKAFDLLKPGGYLYLGLPNIDSWEAHLFGSYWWGLELPRHLYHYSPRSLRKLIGAAGFQEVWFQTPGSYFAHSARYIFDDALRTLGFSRQAAAEGKRTGIPMRILRKAYGLTGAKLAEMAGAGPNIEAVFQKPGSGSR